MCRTDVHPDAQAPLAALLTDMAHAIAEAEGIDLDDIHIGPVDFGPEPTEGPA